MSVVAITVTYNHAATIEPLITSALAEVDRLIVVDNASTDGTLEIVRRYPQVVLIHNRENAGFARAVNVALRLACDADVLLLNPDVWCPPESIVGLAKASAELGGRYILGPRLRYTNGEVQDSARTFPTVARMLSRRTSFGHSRVGSGVLQRHVVCSASERPIEVDWVIGAVMYVPNQVLVRIGAMDERYFLYCEDVDWCLTAWSTGFGVMYVPEVEMVHGYGRASCHTWDMSNRATRQHWESLARFGVKYPRVIVTGQPRRQLHAAH